MSRRVAAPAPDLEAGLPPSTLPEQRRSAPSTLFSVRSLAPQQRRCLLWTLGLNVAIVGLYFLYLFSMGARQPSLLSLPSISGELNLVRPCCTRAVVAFRQAGDGVGGDAVHT